VEDFPLVPVTPITVISCDGCLYLTAGMLKLFGYDSVIDYITKDVSYIVGPQVSQNHFSSHHPGVLFCFEYTDPTGVRSLVKERPDLPFIAHPISHAWFNEPHTLLSQIDSMLKVQAVWNQQYIVSAGSRVSGSVFTPGGSKVSLSTVASGENWEVREIIIPYSGSAE